jgi:hypothetical protein
MTSPLSWKVVEAAATATFDLAMLTGPATSLIQPSPQ